MGSGNNVLHGLAYLRPSIDPANYKSNVEAYKKMKNILIGFASPNSPVKEFTVESLRKEMLEPNITYPGLDEHLASVSKGDLVQDVRGLVGFLTGASVLKDLTPAGHDHKKYVVAYDGFMGTETYTRMVFDMIKKECGVTEEKLVTGTNTKSDRCALKGQKFFDTIDDGNQRLSEMFFDGLTVTEEPITKTVRKSSIKDYHALEGTIVAAMNNGNVTVGVLENANGDNTARINYFKKTPVGKRILSGTPDHLELVSPQNSIYQVEQILPLNKKQFSFLMFCGGVPNSEKLHNYLLDSPELSQFYDERSVR